MRTILKFVVFTIGLWLVYLTSTPRDFAILMDTLIIIVAITVFFELAKIVAIAYYKQKRLQETSHVQ